MWMTSVFESHQTIPSKHTGDGENLSPLLKLADVPLSAQSLVLIMDDPDAPRGTFDHWIVWNLAPDIREIPEGVREWQHLSPHCKYGKNGYGLLGYKGPYPPPGQLHHYHFKLYALDRWLDLPAGSSKQEVEAAMQGHIVDQTELVGIYQRVLP